MLIINPFVLVEIKNKHEEIEVPLTSLDQKNSFKYSSMIIMILGFMLITISRFNYFKRNN